MYAGGQGVPRDFVEAAKWLHKAAEQGSAKAQAGLGILYENGMGVSQDYVQAYLWDSLALANPSLSSSQLNLPAIVQSDLEGLTNKMTPAQIAEAQKLVREWKPKSE
jgi:TPR repeat protein